jgi:hypothetical protein
MSKKSVFNKDETLEVEFEIEDGSAYLCTIHAYVAAINDWVEVPESLSPKIAKKANNLIADYMDARQDHINNELLNAAMSAVKDEYL